MKKELKERPVVKPGEWVYVDSGINAVVCNVYENNDVEVVYLNGRRAINEDVVWLNNCWQFKKQGPSGGYADNYSHLSDYVAQLRKGRFSS
ncbi:MAG: hypothetical protein KAT05_03235 [Spirochaetes bacterium]|nr:hypothetical protein [Spirochaetota bacterium]